MRPPCGRPLPDGTPCIYERAKGKQRCVWHWLASQSADIQALAAQGRLSKHVGELVSRVPASQWPAGERWCSGCQSFVPLFYTSGSQCRSCKSRAAHGRRIEDTYGLAPEEYQALLERQNFRCAICTNRPRSQRLAVDHDHQTGAVRGLLCKRCNHDLLGGGHDSIELLWRAVKYLLEPPAQEVDYLSDAMAIDRLREHLALRRVRVTQEPPPF